MMCPKCYKDKLVKYDVFDCSYYVCLSDSCGRLIKREAYHKMVNEALEEALENV